MSLSVISTVMEKSLYSKVLFVNYSFPPTADSPLAKKILRNLPKIVIKLKFYEC